MLDRSAAQTGAWLAFAAMLLVGGLLWLGWSRTESAPLGRQEAAAPNSPGHEDPERAPLAANGRPRSQGEQRTAVLIEPVAGAVTPAATVLRIRLRGLHPDAPWTVPLHLALGGRDEANAEWLDHSARVAPDAEGRCTFALPAWVENAARQKGRLEAEDPHYLLLQHRWDGAPDLATELVLDAQVVAVLEGRVVNARGEPVPAARVSAFAMRDNTPVDARLGQANTGEQGRYRLKTPPGQPLLLIATPMEPASLSGKQLPGSDGAIADAGVMRDDMLPASSHATGAVGRITTVADLVLQDPAFVRGTVRWADGRPIAKASVWVHALDGTALAITERSSVRLTSTGGFAPTTEVVTDDAGRFRLPAHPGVRCALELARIDGVEIVGDYITAQAVAPQDVELDVPLPLHLRAVREGLPVAGATVEIEVPWPANPTGRLRLPSVSTDVHGDVLAVTTLPNMRLRATADTLQSAWIDVATQPARTVDLVLSTALGELAIEFEGEFPVRQAHFAWTRDGGGEGRQSLLRDDSSGPFRLHLEPGRYHLRVVAAGGERNGLFLLPVERDVEVTTSPRSLTLPAQFGGRFTVHATDDNGLYASGTCRVLDASGSDRTARFVMQHSDGSATVGEPGEVMAGAPNEHNVILPPGDYLLEFDFPQHGTQRRRVAIRKREVSDVHIRLP